MFRRHALHALPLAAVFCCLTLTVALPSASPFGEVGFGSAVSVAALTETPGFLDSRRLAAYQAGNLGTETV